MDVSFLEVAPFSVVLKGNPKKNQNQHLERLQVGGLLLVSIKKQSKQGSDSNFETPPAPSFRRLGLPTAEPDGRPGAGGCSDCLGPDLW